MKYKFLEHTADIKFVVHGKKLKNIFENTVLALSEIISKGAKVKNTFNKRFKISGRDYEELLYNFIDEIIYFLDAENFVPSEAQIKIEEKKDPKGKEKKDLFVLRAIVSGDEAKNYESLEHIKAATYSEIYIQQNKENGKWEAQAVVDV